MQWPIESMDTAHCGSIPSNSSRRMKKHESAQQKAIRSMRKILRIRDKLNNVIAKVKFENCLLIML